MPKIMHMDKNYSGDGGNQIKVGHLVRTSSATGNCNLNLSVDDVNLFCVIGERSDCVINIYANTNNNYFIHVTNYKGETQAGKELNLTYFYTEK